MAFSSFWIWRDSGGWVIWSRSAARPKCSSSATATNDRTWSRVITGPSVVDDARRISFHAESGLDGHRRGYLVSAITPPDVVPRRSPGDLLDQRDHLLV